MANRWVAVWLHLYCNLSWLIFLDPRRYFVFWHAVTMERAPAHETMQAIRQHTVRKRKCIENKLRVASEPSAVAVMVTPANNQLSFLWQIRPATPAFLLNPSTSCSIPFAHCSAGCLPSN